MTFGSLLSAEGFQANRANKLTLSFVLVEFIQVPEDGLGFILDPISTVGATMKIQDKSVGHVDVAG